MRPTVTILALTFLAGCVAPPGATLDPAAAPPPGLPDTLEIDHDHTRMGAHAIRRGLEPPAFQNPLGEAMASSWIYDITLHGDLVFTSVRGANAGLLIADASDLPELPLVAHWRAPVLPGRAAVDPADVHVSADGKLAAVATQIGMPGFVILDVSDPARPVQIAYAPIPTMGAHTVQFADVAGRRLVLAQPAGEEGGAILVPGALYTNSPLNSVLIYELVSEPRPTLRLLSTYHAESLPLGPAPLSTRWQFPHDVRVQEHPITGQTLMYVAYWNAGLRVVDISDPTRPTEVGRNLDKGPAEFLSLHDVLPLPDLYEGRHVTLSSPELITADEPGLLRIYDTTDPAAPELIGHWRVPQDPLPVADLQDTMHRISYAEGHVFIAHRHYGLWVLDISTPELLRAPRLVAYAQDYTAGDLPGAVVGSGRLIQRPGYNDVMWKDGYVVTNEWTTGYYAFPFPIAN